MTQKILDVAVNFPGLKSVLSYKGKSTEDYEVGDILEVPLGRRNALGCVINIHENVNNSIKYKEVTGKENEFFKLSSEEIALYQWISKYYVYSLGKLIFDCLPKHLKRQKEPYFITGKGQDFTFELNEEQQKILVNFDLQNFSQTLIHGITGSGKSLVFFKMIERAIAQNLSVLFLVPEINLTTQFLEFFSVHLEVNVYAYHSSITGGEKFNLWRTVKNIDSAALFVGVRSSIFLPIKNLGLIIVDEEHDSSFKQNDRCQFNARDVAIKKAHLANIPIVMGSATPALENYYRFQNKDNYFTLTSRFGESELPEISVIKNGSEEDDCWPINKSLLQQIESTVSEGYKVIIFVNKLGFSKYLQCKSCYEAFDCPNCSVKLTYFKGREALECHLCEYKEKTPRMCPHCGCLDLFHQGFGVEKVVESLPQFADKIIRFDRDELKNQKDVARVLAEFKSGAKQILIGTQMISKGHNLAGVKLLIILGVDSRLHSTDFRASERVFQEIVQVSGRAGRFGEKAQVYIQSDLRPKFYDFIIDKSFDDFQKDELGHRELLGLPPFQKMAEIVFEGKTEFQAKTKSYQFKDFIEKVSERNHFEVQVRGPISSPIKKRKNKFYWQIYLMSPKNGEISNLLYQVKQTKEALFQDSYINIDP
jgi:primosomal protein N' (replication factor Y)